MSRINSTKGRNKTDSSITSNKNSSDYSKKSQLKKKFTQDLASIDNFSTKENPDSLNIEQTLINFYDYCLDSYNKKLYENLLKEIDINKKMLYRGTRESFNIFIIEIKCLLKLMIEKYENDLNEINDGQMSVSEYINNIQREFSKLNYIINTNDNYEYETITQLYCKFLIYLIIFGQKKEEYFKSLAYITLGINMIKIYFIRKKVTKNIKLYQRYIYFLILLINLLIGEGNFNYALIYSESILKIIESATKVLYNPDNDYDINKKNKYLIEFIRCSGFANIYIGLCHEFKNDQELAIRAYKQAFYFFTKLISPKFHGIKLNEEKIFFDNNLIKISHWFLNRLKTKLYHDKKTRDKIRMTIFLQTINLKKVENIEKNKKLKLVSSGLNENQKKYNIIENKLYENVLNPKNNLIIEKLDKALINLAFKQKKNSYKDKLKKISQNTMEKMCHYQIYNKLMTPKYQEFLMNNKDIKLSYPKDEEDFIHKVNSYLTQDMEIKPHSPKKTKIILKTDKINKDKKLTFLSTSNLINYNKFFASTSTTSPKNKSKIDLNKFNDPFNDNDILNKFKSSKKLTNKEKFDFSSLKLDIPTFTSNIFDTHKMTKSLSDNDYLISKKFKPQKKLKKNFSNNSSMVWSKNNYLNPKYFKRYMKLDKLIKKELNFQKDILNMKGNNSKLYHNSFHKEIFIKGKDKEEEMNQNYMILTEKIEQKVLNNQQEYAKLIHDNIKKKKGLKNKNNSESLVDDILDMNKNLSLDYINEEEKNFNEINQKSLMDVNEKLRNIVYKMKERKKLLRRLNGKYKI